MLLIDHKYASILTIQHNLLIPMNIFINGFRIDEFPKLLHKKAKDKAHSVISQYSVEYNLLITLKFNNSHKLTYAQICR